MVESSFRTDEPIMPTPTLPAIDRALQILQQVAMADAPQSAREISQALAIPLSSVYRHLATLQRWGLLSEAGHDGRYSAGALSLQLALRYQYDASLVALARPQLQRLARLSNETVALMVPTHYQAICIDMIESQQALRCAFATGKGQPLLRGASAKALLAFMAAPQREAALAMNLADPAERAALDAQLDAIRAAGYAESDSEIDPGVWGVSAPLFGRPGRLQGALTLMAPSTRGRERREVLVGLALDAARRISLYLADDAST